MQHIEIHLKNPIKIGDDEEINLLLLRKPKAKDLRNLSNLDKPFSFMLDLAGELCDLSKSEIDNLEIEDAMALVDKVSDFLPQLRPIGVT